MKYSPIVALIACLAALSACDLPRDPEQTTQKLRGGTLTVGVGAAEEPDDPRERDILRRLAQRLDAELRYEQGELHWLVSELEEGRVDLIAGRIPKTTPFAKETGLTAPVSAMTLDGRQVKTVFLIRKGENGFLTEVERAIGVSP